MEEEARAVGFALSGHPYAGYAAKLGGLKNATALDRVDKIEAQPNDRTLYLVAGIVGDIREISTRNGDKMAFVSIDDGTSTKAKRLTMFPDAWAANSHWVKKGTFMAASATIRPDNRDASNGNDLAAEFAYGFEAMQEKLLEAVDVVVDRTDLARLKGVLDKHRSQPAAASADAPERSIQVTVYMPEGDEQYFRATLPSAPVKPSQPLLMDLETTFGADKVKAHQAAGIPLEARPPKNKRGAAPGRRY